MQVAFGVQHAPHRSTPVSAQQMVNCYLEGAPARSKAPVAVVPSHGVANWCTLANLKGANRIKGVPYIVNIDGLYSVNSAGDATQLAAQMFQYDALIEGDGTNIVVLHNELGYVWDGSSLTQISDADFPAATWIGSIDGYYPVIEKDSGRFWINETAYDPTTWNALDFETASVYPDNLIWGIVDKKEIILFGDESGEFFYNSGNADFPFERVPNGFFDIGIWSRYAAGRNSNSVFFLGDDGVAYQLNGYLPARISGHAFEQAVEGYTGDCRVFTWKESGHSMVGYKFDTACWVFDLNTQLWHTRETYQGSTWNACFVIKGYGQDHLVGAATLGKLTPDLFTEFGDILRMKCVSASIYSDKVEIEHDVLNLDFEAGTGPADVMLRFSDDGGKTWSDPIVESTGELGDYEGRVIFGPLGTARDRVYEVAISDAQRRTLMGATLNEWD